MTIVSRKLVLAAGIALALTGVGTAFAADSKPQAGVSAEVIDARHEAQIWTSYATNPHLRAFDLKVEVKGDKATLDGKVQSPIARDLAEQIAMGVDGVKRVDNRIVVDTSHEPTAGRGTSDSSFGDKVEDATITASIKSKLAWNTHTDATDIHVDTKNDRVTLTGTAGSAEEKALAGRIARSTSGVMGVTNSIVVQGSQGKTDKSTVVTKTAGINSHEPVSDGWITAKVKSSMLLTRDVDGTELTVTTVNGAVSLNGDVDSKFEKDRAIEVAQNIRGVKTVDSSGVKIR